LPQVRRIFTAISTSLSLGSRQCGQRYAIRAGRNFMISAVSRGIDYTFT
jgi:hypothetical protein